MAIEEYTTWNPADKHADITLSNGNLTATETALTYNWNSVRSILGVSTGKWYWEITLTGTPFAAGYYEVGIGDSGVNLLGEIYQDVDGYDYLGSSGDKGNNNSREAYGDAFDTGDIVSVALDMDNGKIWWAKNGVWQSSGDPGAGINEAYSGISGTFYAMACIYRDGAQIANFGASAFSHSVPSGFEAGFGTLAAPTSIFDLQTEVRSSEEVLIDLSFSIEVGLESLSDLNVETRAGGTSVIDLKSDIAVDFLTDFSNLSTEVSTEAQQISDLLTEVCVGNQTLIDLHADIRIRAQVISDLSIDISALTYNFRNLNTEITAIRSKGWLNTEIKVGCSARWNFNIEWNPNRFLNTEIEVKKPYEFSFTTQTGVGYPVTNPEVELLISGYSQPIRTLFLDYIQVGNTNEYLFQLWAARGLIGKGTLKNAKIKAEYINTQDSGGFEIVSCDWLSVKIDDGEYQIVNETPANLGNIPCDSKLDITLKVECRDCSLTRGLAFFKLIITGDWKEAVYGGQTVYRDNSLYHTGEFDDYCSNDFICRLYVVE